MSGRVTDAELGAIFRRILGGCSWFYDGNNPPRLVIDDHFEITAEQRQILDRYDIDPEPPPTEGSTA